MYTRKYYENDNNYIINGTVEELHYELFYLDEKAEIDKINRIGEIIKEAKEEELAFSAHSKEEALFYIESIHEIDENGEYKDNFSIGSMKRDLINGYTKLWDEKYTNDLNLRVLNNYGDEIIIALVDNISVAANVYMKEDFLELSHKEFKAIINEIWFYRDNYGYEEED